MGPSRNHLKLLPDGGYLTTLDEARSCVVAAESLSRRACAPSLNIDPDQRGPLWAEHDHQVDRATYLLDSLRTGPSIDQPKPPTKLALI
jgi:hypothetical protein